MDIKEIELLINKLAREYSEIDEKDVAVRRSKISEICVMIYDDYYFRYLKNFIRKSGASNFDDDGIRDVINDAFFYSIKKYDYSQCDKYTAYLISNIRYKLKDAYKVYKREINRCSSYDSCYEDDDKSDEINTISDDSLRVDITLEEKENSIALFLDLQSMITRFYEHNQGKSANEKRYYYTRLFCTEYSVSYVKNEPGLINMINVNDFFEAIDTGFLNFFMSDECFDVGQIYTTSLKKYSDVLEKCQTDKSEKEIEFPFQADIYISYIYQTRNERVSNAVITQQKGHYMSKFKEIRIQADYLDKNIKIDISI